MSAPDDQAPIQLIDIWSMLRRRAAPSIVVAMVAAIAVFVAPSLVMPTLYRAEATLAMGRGLKAVDFQRDPAAGFVPDQLVNTQRELLASKTVLSDALAMGGLLSNPSYAKSSDPVSLLQARLRSTAVKNSWVISVSLDDEDPVRAEAGLQSVLDAFLAHQATQNRERAATDAAFIDGQIVDATRKLDSSRDTERRFREANHIASTDPDNNHITTRIRTLAERQGALDERIADCASRAHLVEAADAMPDRQQRLGTYLRLESNSTMSLLGAMQKDLFDLVGQEAELSSRYLEKHPKLIEVRNHIASKRAQLDDAIAATRNAVVTEHQAVIAQRAELVSTQESLQRELNSYREHLLALQRLAQESTAQQKVLDELQNRRAQLAATADYDEQRMVVDGRPTSSPLPRGVGILPLGGLSVLAGAIAAVVAAATIDSFDRTVRDLRHIKSATGLRALGEITGPTGLQPLCVTGPADPPELASSARALWTSIRFTVANEMACQVLVILSPEHGDGRSTTATRLAVSAALAGSRTLLVDADLHHPSLAAQFGVTRNIGLAELLAGTPDLTPSPTSVPNLDLMPAGQPSAAPGALFSSHCLPEWIAYIRSHYDVIIVDTPALADAMDGTVVGNIADGVLLLVHAGHTSRDGLNAAWERLTPLQARVIGCALARQG